MDIATILLQVLLTSVVAGAGWFIMRLSKKVDDIAVTHVDKQTLDRHIEELGGKIDGVDNRLDRVFEILLHNKISNGTND